jgi:hypothetical protein
VDPQARQGVPRSGLGARQSGQISWELCVIEVIFRLSNAGRQPLGIAGATQERTLFPVGWTPLLGPLSSGVCL